jgi:hypothetical protein
LTSVGSVPKLCAACSRFGEETGSDPILYNPPSDGSCRLLLRTAA